MPARPVSLAAVTFTMLVVSISGLAAGSAEAAWSASGNAVATAADVDETFRAFTHNVPSTCSDGRGGLIATWVRAGQDSVMVQRLDHTGARRWNGSTGVLVSAASTDIPGNAIPSILADTDGGCWVAWYDARSGASGVYVQHFDADGVPQLAAGGLRVTAEGGGVDYRLPLALTASKKLLVAWVDNGDVLSPDSLKAQRVRANGTLDWGTGLALDAHDRNPGEPSPYLHQIFADGEGVVGLWQIETRVLLGPSFSSLWGGRLDASGVSQWGDGLQIFDGFRNVGVPLPAASFVGGVDSAWDATLGLWVAFQKLPGGVCVQRATPDGALQIGTADVPTVIGDSNGGFDDIACTLAGGDQLIVGWLSGSSSTSVFAQRVSSFGSQVWGAGDVLVASGAGARSQIDVAPDAGGGAYLVYTDTAPGADLDDVVVKHIDASGALLWTGLARTTSTSGAERAPDAMPDGGGGLLLVWEDDRDAAASTTTTDLYAKHFEADGDVFVAQLTLVSPNGGASYESMFPLPVTWASNVGGEVALTYTSSGGSPVTITSATADDGVFTWAPPPISASFLRMQISIAGEPTIADASDADFRMCPTLATGTLIAGSVFTPYDVQTADFNEDGILDLAVAGASGVTVLLGAGSGGVGNGNFGAPSLFGLANARRIAVGDFDEDGILDLAVAHAAGVSTLRGDGAAGVGDGTFAAAGLLSGLSSAADVVAGDFDNDGVLDLAAADSVNNRVAVFRGTNGTALGNGSGDFANPLYFITGDQPCAVAAGDIERDGDLDLAVANAGGTSVTLLRNTGASGFGAIAFTTLQTRTAPARPNAVMLYDFDGDMDLDLLVGTDLGLSRDHCTILGGTPLFESWVDHPGLPVHDMTLVDLGRNGLADVLAVGPAGAAQLYVAEGTSGVGSGVFTPAGAIGTGGAVPAGIVSADFNEDGRPDLAFANLATNDVGRSLGGCSAITSSPVLVTPDGGQVWTPNTPRTIEWTKPASHASVDLDVSRDGGANWEPIAERVTGTQYTWLATHPVSEDARVRVRSHDYRHREDVSAADFTICGPFDSTASYPVASLPLDLALFDVDRDGIQDLAQVFFDGVRVRRGLGGAGVGDGSFGPDTFYASRDSARALAVIDYDHANGPDLAVVTDQGVEIWAALASGGLDRVVALTARKFNAVVAGDVDNDGDEDVVACDDSARVIVFLRRDPSGLVTAQTLARAGRTSALALGDLDEDGDLDLAWSERGVSSPFWRALYSAGTFGVTGAFTSGEGLDLALADLNEDDIADAAVLTTTGVVVVLGTGAGGVGNGGFGTAAAVGATTTGRRIETADWNADGRIDLMVAGGAGFLGGNLRTYYGLGTAANGNGTFSREEMLVTGLLPYSLAFGDLLEDGRLDFVVGLQNQVLAVLGACSDPPGALTLLAPVAGEAMQGNALRDIQWTKPATGHPVDLSLSLDDGATWRPIAREVAGTKFKWKPPGVVTQLARVRVEDARLRNSADATDYAFVIYLDPLDAGDGPPVSSVAFRSAGANPSRGATRFALSLPAAGEANVEIFDAAGRRVRTLLRGPQHAGEHALVWDGRDDGGRAQGPGVYLARARAGAFEQSRRFVRVE